jgi:uncharacterized lipoprotein YehR (DUF1307 family)
METNEKIIQIVAFSTNINSSQFSSPYEIIKIFLKYHDHILLKQRIGLALAFKTLLPKSKLDTQIMICSVFDLLREYNGIKNVNCYLLFIDLESKDSNEQLHLIIQYYLKYCNLSRKIYIIGLFNSYVENRKKNIDEEQIKEILKKANINKFVYKEMNIEDQQKISDMISEIFINAESLPKKKKIKTDNKENCLIY